MGIFSKLFKKNRGEAPAPETVQAVPEPKVIPEEPTPTPPPKKWQTHKVAGLTHYMDNAWKLADENAAYYMTKRDLIDEGLTDERVYQYSFHTGKAELVPEPDNPQDPKAIKVVTGGQHIGYIKAGSCARIHKLLREDRIKSLFCEIEGGKYKIVQSYEEDGKDKYYMEKDEVPFFARVEILEK